MAEPSSGSPSLARRRRVGGEGDLEVFVADEQDEIPLEPQRWAALAEAVLRAEGVRGLAELSLLFVGRDEITALNEQFMGVSEPTDVLAFPIDAADVEVVSSWSPAPDNRGPDRAEPDPGDQPLLLGDVVICPVVAAENAADHAGTFDDELALLTVHGILHVLGHDHAEPEQATRMQTRERELLEAHHWHGPAPDDFRHEHRDGPVTS